MTASMLETESLFNVLGTPFVGDDAAPSTIAALTEDVRKLGKAAYFDNDAQAADQAERLMYAINIKSTFAAPFHAEASIVWTELVRAKLNGIDRRFPVEPVSVEAMTHKLNAAVQELGAFNHSFLDRIATSEDQRPVDVFVHNWYGSCYGFSAQLSALSQRCTGPAKAIVVENLADELEGPTHDVLRDRYINHMGFHFDPVGALQDELRVTASFSILNMRTAYCNFTQPHMGLGMFFTAEANWPPECAKHLKYLRARGVDEHVLEYWTSHGELDVHHAEEWLTMLGDYCNNDEERGRAVQGAVSHLTIRREMYDAMEKLAFDGAA